MSRFSLKWGRGRLKTLTEDELMQLIAESNGLAFEILFDRHSAKVLGYCRRLLGEEGKAEDLSQDTWLKVLRAAPSYQGQGHFIAWIYTLIRNTALTELKKSKKWQLEQDIDTPTPATESAADIETPEAWFEKNQDFEHLKKQVDALPSRQRAALLLSVREELSYEEIGKALGISVSSVKSLLFRARKSLLSGERK